MKKNILIFVVSILMISCSSSSDNDKNHENSPKLPSSELLQVTLPTTAPAEAQSFAALSNLGTVFISAYGNLPNGSVKNGVYSWSLTYEGMSLIVNASEAQNGDYAWEFRIDGKDPSNQTVYNNWLFMSGQVSADGRSGYWAMYDFESQANTEVMSSEWATDTNGTITSTVTISGSSNDGPDVTYMIIQNTDGSGSLSVKHGNTAVYTCTWNSDGTGTWEDHINQLNGTF